MAVLDAGLTATLSREFARVDNSREEKIRIFKTLESSYFVIVAFSIVLLFSLSEIIADKWLNLSTFNKERVSLFLKIISFDVGFQLLFRFYLGGLLGLEKQIRANVFQIGWGILRNGLVVVAILLVPRLEVFFLWQALSTVIFAILLGLSLRKTLTGRSNLDFKPKIEREVFRQVWRFAVGMLLISIVASLNTQIDKLAISKLLPLESLGYYTLAVSLSISITVLVNPISIALLPRFTALYSGGGKDEAIKLFNKVNLFVAIIVFSIMAIIIFFPKELIWIWTGKMELAERTQIYLPITAMSYAMLSLQIIPYNIAIANAYTKSNNYLGIISLFITIPGYWLATKQYGAIGAACVFCIAQTIITLVYVFIIGRKFLERNGLSTIYLKQIFLPILISICVVWIFSSLPNLVGYGRIISLAIIGFIALVTVIINALLLIPLTDLKHMLKVNSIYKLN